MSTTSNFGLLDFVFFTGVLEWLGPVNSHKSIRSSAEIRGDTSAFRSSNLMESLDFKRRKIILKVIEYTVLFETSIYLTTSKRNNPVRQKQIFSL